MHRYAGRLAKRHEAGHDGVGIALARANHLAVHVGGDTTHIVVAGGKDRDRRILNVHAGKNARQIGDAGQPLIQEIGVEVFEMEVHIVLVRAGDRGLP